MWTMTTFRSFFTTALMLGFAFSAARAADDPLVLLPQYEQVWSALAADDLLPPRTPRRSSRHPQPACINPVSPHRPRRRRSQRSGGRAGGVQALSTRAIALAHDAKVTSWRLARWLRRTGCNRPGKSATPTSARPALLRRDQGLSWRTVLVMIWSEHFFAMHWTAAFRCFLETRRPRRVSHIIRGGCAAPPVSDRQEAQLAFPDFHCGACRPRVFASGCVGPDHAERTANERSGSVGAICIRQPRAGNCQS